LAFIAVEATGEFQIQAAGANRKYIADFVCHESKMIVEVDGGQHAENRRDEERDRWFAEAGYRVVRYWNNDVLKNPNGVLEALLSELAARSAK